MIQIAAARPLTSRALIATALLGIAWNAFGVFQFVNSVTASVDDMVRNGLTPAQASLYAGLPLWMDLAFAAGVSGGLAGSLLLLARRAAAVPVFALSLVAYVLLFAGDIIEGVFAAFGARQVAILTFVVAIAAGLLWGARHFRARNLLR